MGAKLLHRNHESIDLILTDVAMPRVGGPQLITDLNEAGFKPRVLFMSGFTNNAFNHPGHQNGEIDLVQKPFKPGELARRVRQALDR